MTGGKTLKNKYSTFRSLHKQSPCTVKKNYIYKYSWHILGIIYARERILSSNQQIYPQRKGLSSISKDWQIIVSLHEVQIKW